MCVHACGACVCGVCMCVVCVCVCVVMFYIIHISASKLKGAGSVWEACDSVAKLPKDNRSAVLKVFIAQLHLLKDVCAQVDEVSF